MPWINLGVLTTYPDNWVSTIAVTDIPLIRISWLKGNAKLSEINSRFLVRRKFVSGEVDKAQIVYASDEPLIIPYQDLGESFAVQIKKLMPHRQLISEPFYQLSIDYYLI